MSTEDLGKYLNTANLKNAALHFRTYGFRSMFRKTIDYVESTRNYDKWIRSHIPSKELLEQQKNHTFSYQPKISIIVPVYKTPAVFLKQMIDSVINQTYPDWELCIADGSADPSCAYLKELVQTYQKQYPNILYSYLPENYGISGNTNAALSLATGEFIALLDHDDALTPDALFEIAAALNTDPGIDVLYSDEDKTTTDFRSFYNPYFKPDFNLDLLRSCNYITHFFVVRKQIVDMIGGFSTECDGSQDYDFILKSCERASHIYHIPKILYHWRIHPASVAGDPESKTYAYRSAVNALQNHLIRCGENGTVSKAEQFGYYKINYAFSGSPLVSIVLFRCSAHLQEQIQSISTYKNIEFVSSHEKSKGRFLIFLHHVKKILTPDWIEQLLGNCSRPSSGLVSAKSFYKKGKILEYGLVFSCDGQLHSPFYKFNEWDTGYCYHAKTQRDCSMVSPYCIMIRTDLLEKYFDNLVSDHFVQNIYHLCHTLNFNKLSVVLLPDVAVLCNETKQSLPVLDFCSGKNDPYYNPNFSDKKIYHLS